MSNTLLAAVCIVGWLGLGYCGWRIGRAAVIRSLKRSFYNYQHRPDHTDTLMASYITILGPLGLISSVIFAAVEDRQK